MSECLSGIISVRLLRSDAREGSNLNKIHWCVMLRNGHSPTGTKKSARSVAARNGYVTAVAVAVGQRQRLYSRVRMFTACYLSSFESTVVNYYITQYEGVETWSRPLRCMHSRHTCPLPLRGGMPTTVGSGVWCCVRSKIDPFLSTRCIIIIIMIEQR